MNQLSRSTGLKIAAAILWAVALLGIFAIGIPFLTSGMATIEQAAAAGEGPPFWLVILSFAVDSITMVVAYAVWRGERLGIILAIVISVFNAILNTFGALFDPNMAVRIMAGVFVFASLGVIYLCLRREPKSLAESV